MRVRRHWLAGLAGLLVAASLQTAQACQGNKVLFEDKFTAWDQAWGQPADNIKTSGGKMVIDTQGQAVVSHLLNQNNAYGDSSFCATVRFAATEDPNNTVAGMVFWGADDSHYYFIGVSAGGLFSVQRKVSDTRFLSPIQWASNPAIKSGAGQQHDLEVQTKGGQATVLVDGAKVGEVNGQMPDGGSLIGIYWSVTAEAKAVVEFSGIKVMN
jgi:hypothetical protein